MEDAIPDQTAAFQRNAETLVKGVNFLARAAAVGVLTAVLPGAPLLLARDWHRLRGDKNHFIDGETFHPDFVKEYEIGPNHPKYGLLKRQMDSMLAEAGQPPGQLLAVDPLFEVRSGAYTRSRTVAFKEEYLEVMNAEERETLLRHEVGHLVRREMRQRDAAQEFMMNAKQVCLHFGLPIAATVGVVVKAIEYNAPHLFQKAADLITQVPSLIPLTPGNMLLNAALNAVVAYPAARIVYHALARRAEFAADQYVIDHPKGGIDKLTRALLRATYLPDRARQMAVPMKAVLEKPRLTWHLLKDKLTKRRIMAEHPDAPERIRAGYVHAQSKDVTPQLGVNDTWRANATPRL